MLADLVHSAEVCVLQGRGCLSFVDEAFSVFEISCEIGRKELQGYSALEQSVFGTTHHTHASLTQLLEDFMM